MSEQILKQKTRGRPKKVQTLENIEEKPHKPRGRPKLEKTPEELQQQKEAQKKAKAEYMRVYIKEYYKYNKEKFGFKNFPSDEPKPIGRPKGEIHQHVINDTGKSPQVRCPHCNCIYTLNNHRHVNSMKCKYARLLKEI